MESLTEIIVALIKNSLDANCTSIAIRICLELFWIQILDNGDGISREDLQSIGKCCLLNIDHDRKKPSKQFARLTGESLLSIIAQCEEVLIESVDSKTNHGKCHSRLFKQQTAISPRNEGSQRNFDSVSQYQYVRKSRGTTVTLKNVFYKNAERQRNHSIKEDYQTLLVKIRTLALVHYDRSFTVQDLANTEVVFKSKRLSAFLPKYCELYRLSETDIDVTTCRKDNVLIECYFSERRTRHPLSPIELTFINGLPSGELMPTVNELLTQEKHNIDFVIVVTFPKNDVLTQLNEPVHHDEEDILYGLSQPVDDSQTTFDKCTKWLKTNDFDVPAEIGSTSKEQKHPSKKAPAANKERQKINFFDVAAGDDRRRINSSPQKKQTFKRPVPKFHPTKPNKKPEKLQKANKQPNFKKEFEVIERPPEKMSFLNIASEINVSRITMPLEETLPPANKLQQFAKKEKKKLLHSPPEAIPPFETKKEELTFFPEFEVSHPDEATSFLNDSCSPTEKKGCFQVTPQVEDVVETKTEPNIVHCLENFSSSSGSPDAVSSDISYAFAEPLFLEPILEPEDDTFNVGSPDARFFDFDLVQSYREFHKACRETIQYFKVAIEAIETSDCSSDEGCACCNTHQFNREIEILRQPFHQPRNILAKVGPRR
ncbi:AAEL004171-PA [Aedes aegypti]|uniref:AAEL004171-PA n=1 Tax=Aedes aegypti TaxID=7159 RepID=Q0IFT2_AEDAE|nr:AAEL004171-PA [Aedes aegypti]